ncbi:unnamed protein product [Rhizophagus irregularis]|nr:unnamed protein product [Rhizophagus irregularis]
MNIKPLIGTDKNDVKAFEWIKKSAEQGYVYAQKKLNLYYEKGIGIEKDEIKAYYWYERAAINQDNIEDETGLIKGNVKLVFECFKEVKNENVNIINAKNWIEDAIDHEKVKLIPYNELENVESFKQGGFGQISKAIWNKLNDNVICKKLTKATNIKHDLLDEFIHELKIHLRLDYSERIVRCLGISIDQKTNDHFLIMQYANGGDLQNYLKENFEKLTWDNKKKLAFQIAEGLNYLHNENILHRDLHSKNIVIHDDNAKITDFGISKIQDNTTTFIGTIGVASYIEPKRLSDPNYKYTKPSDIYSFGVLMWEISSGEPPFKDCDNKTVAISVISGIRETPVPDTPKEYENLYKNCWRQEPEQRPDIKEVLNEFKKMIVGIKLRKDSESQISYRSDNSSTSASNVQASCDSDDFCIQLRIIKLTIIIFYKINSLKFSKYAMAKGTHSTYFTLKTLFILA